MSNDTATLVTDTGFRPDDWKTGFETPDTDGPLNAIELAPDSDVHALKAQLDDIEIIRIQFPSFADGRGFTLARRLRAMGYQGRMRAAGHVLADQYAMARRSGFDEVQIDAALAARQPEEQWRARANWRENDYLARLRG